MFAFWIILVNLLCFAFWGMSCLAFRGGAHQVSIITWPEKIAPGTALEVMQTMSADVKRWMGQLKCNHVAASQQLIRTLFGQFGLVLLYVWFVIVLF